MSNLRPYQQECLQAIKTNLAAGVSRQLVVAATGTGKTAILSNLPASLGIRRMLVLAHRDELLDQAAEKLRHWNPRLRIAIEAGEQRSAATADYSVFDSYGQIAAKTKQIWLVPTAHEQQAAWSWAHPLLTSSHVLLCAFKD